MDRGIVTLLAKRTPEQLRSFSLQAVSVPGALFLLALCLLAGFSPEWARWVVAAGAVVGVLLTVLARCWPHLATEPFIRGVLLATMALTLVIGLTIEPQGIGSLSAFVFIGISVGGCAVFPIRRSLVFSAVCLLLGLFVIAERSLVALVGTVIFVAVNATITLVIVVLRQSLQAARDEAVTLSLADALTGLANRRSMELNVPLMSALAERTSQRLGCLVLDLDHFKAVNDTYGHLVGDRVLKVTADALTTGTRNSDLCVRVGGDEFCVFTVVEGRDELAAVGERLRAAIEQLQVEPKTTVSVGGALLPVGAGMAGRGSKPTVEKLLEGADRALYEAKSAGRNFVRID